MGSNAFLCVYAAYEYVIQGGGGLAPLLNCSFCFEKYVLGEDVVCDRKECDI